MESKGKDVAITVPIGGGVAGSLDKLPGDTFEAKVKNSVSAAPVVVVAKEFCPFCVEVRRTFDELGVPYTVYNVDTMPDGGKMHEALKAEYKQTTVPYVFIGGVLLGGCDSTKAAQADGSLFTKLAAAGVPVKAPAVRGVSGSALREGTHRASGAMFRFPDVVDDHVIRLTSVWIVIICVLCAVFYKRDQSHWVMGGLMVDFLLRLYGGANISPLGSLSVCLLSFAELFGRKPRWVAGPPKQFAALCGVMFSSPAFFFFLMEVHEPKLVNVGLAFTCALGVAAALEAFLGFCLGCWFFQLMIQIKMVPADVYMVFTNTRDEQEYFWNDMNKQLHEDAPQPYKKHFFGEPTQADYTYKAKTDDQTREDFHIIKHVKIMHFLVHMGLAGLACAWKLASPWESLYAPTPVQYAIALTAAFLFVVWLVLYALKMAMYPQKVLKEWQCPLRGNAFAVPFVTCILFAYLVKDDAHAFANVLFWIGAPACLALGLIWVADWIMRRLELEHINAAWMIAPVSNSVAAMVGPMLQAQYRDACQVWFAFAFLMWMVLMVITFYKAVIKVNDDDRLRPLLTIWVAAPAVLAVAYTQCFPATASSIVTTGAYNDFIYINLHWFSVTLALVLLWTACRPFFGLHRFDMSYWAVAFPADALAFTCIYYNQVKPGGLSGGIAYAALAAASTINCVLCLQTLAGILRRKVFVPDYKWGPLSFMRLTHEAFRGAMTQLLSAAELACGPSATPESKARLAELWTMMELAHHEHSRHEDEVIFKSYEEYFPGVAAPYSEEHEEHNAATKQTRGAVAVLASGAGADAGASVLASLRSYVKELGQHLRGEEDHVQAMPRKHIPLDVHKRIVRQCFELTTCTNWRLLMPWIINSMPMLHQRVRFIKTLLWAMPERAQLVGLMVGLGVDAVQWKRITDELPEIIPRGVPGWVRYY